jgi:hypothetical protein
MRQASKSELTAPPWLRSFRESVSWGKEISFGAVEDIECCWVCSAEVGGWYYWVPGSLDELPAAIARGIALAEATGFRCALLFIDMEATDAQVEEAMVRARDAGLGCGFIEVGPRVAGNRLLFLYSEGTVLNLL